MLVCSLVLPNQTSQCNANSVRFLARERETNRNAPPRVPPRSRTAPRWVKPEEAKTTTVNHMLLRLLSFLEGRHTPALEILMLMRSNQYHTAHPSIHSSTQHPPDRIPARVRSIQQASCGQQRCARVQCRKHRPWARAVSHRRGRAGAERSKRLWVAPEEHR